MDKQRLAALLTSPQWQSISEDDRVAALARHWPEFAQLPEMEKPAALRKMAELAQQNVQQEVPWYSKPIVSLKEPLVGPTVEGVGEGVVAGVAGLLEESLTPAALGVGAVAGGALLGLAGTAVGGPLLAIAGLGGLAYAGYEAVSSIPDIADAIQEGAYGSAAEMSTRAALNLGLAYGGAKAATKGLSKIGDAGPLITTKRPDVGKPAGAATNEFIPTIFKDRTYAPRAVDTINEKLWLMAGEEGKLGPEHGDILWQGAISSLLDKKTKGVQASAVELMQAATGWVMKNGTDWAQFHKAITSALKLDKTMGGLRAAYKGGVELAAPFLGRRKVDPRIVAAIRDSRIKAALETAENAPEGAKVPDPWIIHGHERRVINHQFPDPEDAAFMLERIERYPINDVKSKVSFKDVVRQAATMMMSAKQAARKGDQALRNVQFYAHAMMRWKAMFERRKQLTETIASLRKKGASTSQLDIELSQVNADMDVYGKAVLGHGTGAGRTLAMHKHFIAAGNEAMTNELKARKYLAKYGYSDEQIGTVLKAFRDIDDPEEQLSFIRKYARMGKADYAIWYVYTNLLTNPATQARNMIGNSMLQAFNETAHPFAIALDAVGALVQKRPREMYVGEMPKRLVGMWEGLKSGLWQATHIMKKGIPPEAISAFDIPPPEVGQQWGDTSRLLLNAHTRLLAAVDRVFRGMSTEANRYSAAYAKARKLYGKKGADKFVDHLDDDDVLELAITEGTKSVFQEPEGGFGSWLNSIKQHSSPWIRVPMSMLLPFIRTPLNILKRGLKSTALGFASPEYRSLKGREKRMFEARALFGTTMLMPIALWAAEGRISGKGPDDYRQRAALMLSGWQPDSIRLPITDKQAKELKSAGANVTKHTTGDYWVEYTLMQPLNVPMSLVGNAFEDYEFKRKKGQLHPGDVITMGIKSFSALADQSYLTGLMNVANAINDPDKWTENLVRSMAMTLTPAGALQRGMAVGEDPVVRAPGKFEEVGAYEGVKEAIVVNTFLSNRLLPRLGVDGEVMTRQSTWDSPWLRSFVVPRTAPQYDDPVTTELLDIGYYPDVPGRGMQLRDGRQLAPEEETWLGMLKGRWRWASWQKVVQSPRYQAIQNKDARKKILSTVGQQSSQFVNAYAKALPTVPYHLSEEEKVAWVRRYHEEAKRLMRPWLASRKRAELSRETAFRDPMTVLNTLLRLAHTAKDRTNDALGVNIDQ